MFRISPGTMTVGIFAVLFGLVGAYSVRRYLHVPEQPEPPAPAVTTVPLAGTDLEPGKVLATGDIVLVPMTQAEMQKRGLPLEQTMLDARQIAGRILREPVHTGEAFLISKLYPDGMGPSLADRLAPGYRAVTVPIQVSGAVDGFAQPGSLVDVVFRTSAVRNSQSADIPDATFTLLERVEVLAVGDNSTPGSRPDNNRIASVTLAVAPEQAQALKAVEGRGQLSLALRSPSDTFAASNSHDHVTLEQLLGLKPQRPTFVAEIYRGAARQTVTFERDQVEHEQFGGLARSRTPVAPQASMTPAPGTVATPAAFADGSVPPSGAVEN